MKSCVILGGWLDRGPILKMSYTGPNEKFFGPILTIFTYWVKYYHYFNFSIVIPLGYSVSFDDGKPHTTPPIADLWIGHSRGCDRLQYAPKHTRTLAINGIHPVCSTPRGDCLGEINNPDDITVSSSWTPDQGVNDAHFIMTPSMVRELVSRVGDG